mgnify:CR=1 FL=1
MQDVREAIVENAFRRWCEANGHRCLKLTLEGRRGFPDRTVITANGRTAFVEFKRPGGGTVSRQQAEWGDDLKRRGAPYLLTDSTDEAIQFIESLN